MKRLQLALTTAVAGLFFSTVSSNTYGQTVELKKGWNLKGSPCSMNMSVFNNQDISTVWKWEGGKWAVWSPDPKIMNIIQFYGLDVINSIEPLDGFWINAKNDTTLEFCSQGGESSSSSEAKTSLKKVLEGKFNDVYSSLSSKKNLTDEEKVAFALSILGKSIDTNFLQKVGAPIIFGNGDFFHVGSAQKDPIEDVNATEWRSSVQNLLDAINSALEELDKVSSNVKFEVPSEFVDGDEVIVDKPSLDALRGLLLAKKAILQYLLAYDWSVYDEIDEEDAILPYLEKLSIKDGSYILNAKDTLKEAIKLLSQASIEESKLTADYKKSLLYWLTTDEEGNGLDKEEFEGLAQNTLLGILNSVNATVPISVPNPEDTYTQVVKLSYLFSDPLKGEKIKQDVSSGKIIEVKVCEGGGCFIDANGTKTCYCDDKENDIWFTEDSYLYKYIKTISPDAKLHQRKLNGNIYYTLSDNDYGWNLTSPEVVYPNTE